MGQRPQLADSLHAQLFWSKILIRLQRYRVLCRREVTDDHVSWHAHPGNEFVFVRQGRGVFTVAGDSISFESPALFYLDGSVPHGVVTHGTYDRWSLCYWPQTNESEHDALHHALLRAHPASMVALSRTDAAYLDELLRRIEEDLRERPPFADETVRIHVKAVEYLFARLIHSKSPENVRTLQASQTPTPTSSLNIEHLLAVIETSIPRADVTAGEIAARMGFSEQHISRVLRSVTGYPLGQYLRHRRIERAKELLARTPLPVSRIAESVGLPSLPHFSRVFKRITGLSPTAYRATKTRSAGRSSSL